MSGAKRFTATTSVTVPPVTVVGGGIAGLATAVALAQRGSKVAVHERADRLRTEGAGLQITPNGARVLAALGLDVALKDHAIRAEAVVPMDGLTGRSIARFALASKLPGYHLLHRGDLLGLLEKACIAAGVAIHTASAVTPGALPANGIVVAADGLHSGFRPVLNGLGKPFFTGQVAWRAVVPGTAPAEARIWMLPGRHVVSYPLPGGLINIVAVQARDAWAAEGWSHPDEPAHLLAAFGDAAPALRELLARVTQVNLWGLFRHQVADAWVGNEICLVGDAAHPTLPFLAQGANLALEDAWVLARSIAGGQDLEKAYQSIRKPRVTRAIAAADANARNYHLSGLARQVAHTGLRGIGALAPNAFLRRLDWLYQHDVTA
jgi:salicylate hydroxylase